MFNSPKTLKAGALLLSGAALGGAGGYAASASGASTAHTATPKARHARVQGEQARLRRAVSITAVVPAGNGKFATISVERGTLEAVSGSTITLGEGTPRAAYKTVTVTLPANAVVRLSRQASSLSALSAGDHLTVVQGPHRTLVSARPPRGQ